MSLKSFFPSRTALWSRSLLSLAVAVALLAPVARGQSGSTPPPGQNPGQQDPNKAKDQNSTPEAGGPQGDIGPIAVPKKKDEAPKKDDTPKGPKKIEGMPDFTIRVNAPLVTVDVGVLNKNGGFIPGLKQENFRILEDGVPQTITSFNQTQAPITAVMLVEFANNQYFYNFAYDSIIASATFANNLQKEDWIALISFDIKERILQDFTQDKRAIMSSIGMLQPGMSMSRETNLFDALYDTIDRLETVEGRKYIILVASGKDTFSKKNLDHVLKKIQGSKDIVIYAIGTGQALRYYAESHGYMKYLCEFTSFNCNIEFLQADNQMKSFAKMTGGQFYAPLFQASFRDAVTDIAQTIRNQYTISYHPTNRAADGTYRKIKVELVGPNGAPIQFKDQKGKDVKYQIMAREGYKAKQEVE
jgi:VWFA-related protein